MITCLFITPALLMAQKQKPLKQMQITAKGKAAFGVSASRSVSGVSAEFKQAFIDKKLMERSGLAQELGLSSMLRRHIAGKKGNSPVIGPESVEAGSPAPLINFKGTKDDGTVDNPDASGAVGPNHVMHVNNQEYVIYNKSGAVLSTESPDDFWADYDTVAVAIGYPHVVYDALKGHYYILTLAGDFSTGNYAVLFGSSDTNDPSGTWTTYEVDLGAQFIHDAPLFGYSKRWFTFTTVQYDTASPNDFNSAGIVLMSLDDLIAGTLATIYGTDDANFFSLSPVETLDANINDHYMINNLGSDADTGYLYIVHIGGTTGAPTYNYDDYAVKASPWTGSPAYAPQKNTTNKIYAGSTRLRTAQYRNGQIWTCHTVYLPEAAPTRAVAQWWQIKVSNFTVSQFGRVETANNSIMYGYPSLAVNKHDDMLMGYTYFATNKFATAAYSYRNGSDGKNKLRKAKTYKTGKATFYQNGASGVTFDWGSYSSTSVDETDSTFWTVQEYAEKPADTWGTWWAKVDNVVVAKNGESPAPSRTFGGNLVLNLSPNPAKSITSLNWDIEKAGNVQIKVTNAQGAVLISKNFSAQKGNNRTTLNVANLTSGVYSVTITNGTEIKKAQLVIE